MITGFVESIDRFQVRGWAFDTEEPSDYLSVEIEGAGERLGYTVADLYRHDLEAAGHGNGCHAFVLNLDRALSEAEFPGVRAYVVKASGEKILLRLLSLPVTPRKADPQKISYEGKTSDATKFPVFVLGAARSGTSAVAQALLRLERFEGEEEGHALDCLAYLSSGLETFYAMKGGEVNRSTMLAGISPSYFSDAIAQIFCDLVDRYYRKDFWIEKTPNATSVSLAPRFRELWPNARFIFLKRRAIENIRSREAKFPDVGFVTHCQDWVAVMSAWRIVRNRLAACAIEVDQLYLAREPKAAGGFIGRFLGLDELESDRLGQYFMSERPERTRLDFSATSTGTEVGWDEDRWSIFTEVCSTTMELFNYSFGSDYFKDGSLENMARVL